MQTEILCFVIGVAAGLFINRNQGKLDVNKQNPIVNLEELKVNRLDKLLHNIESYDGTEKNQIQIEIEEE